MKELIKLAEEIYNEALKDKVSITWEEAQDIAKMEIKAKEIKRYEKSETPRKKTSKERKVDHDKKYLLNHLQTRLVAETDAHDFTVKNESEFSFQFMSNFYTVKLIKHRPQK